MKVSVEGWLGESDLRLTAFSYGRDPDNPDTGGIVRVASRRRGRLLIQRQDEYRKSVCLMKLLNHTGVEKPKRGSAAGKIGLS